MRVDLLIEGNPASMRSWRAAAQELNRLGSSDAVPFITALLPAGAGGSRPGQIVLAVCSAAIDIEVVMTVVFTALCEFCRGDGVRAFTIALRSGGALGEMAGTVADAEIVLQQLMPRFRDLCGDAVARALAREHSRVVDTLDQARALFERVLGTRRTGVIREEVADGATGYALSIPAGRVVALPAAVGRGWVVAEFLRGRQREERQWTTIAHQGVLNTCLQLGFYLPDLASPLDPVFSHAQVELTRRIERKNFQTRLGALVFHSRAPGARDAHPEIAIQLPALGEIRGYEAGPAAVERRYRLLDKLPF